MKKKAHRFFQKIYVIFSVIYFNSNIFIINSYIINIQYIII